MTGGRLFQRFGAAYTNARSPKLALDFPGKIWVGFEHFNCVHLKEKLFQTVQTKKYLDPHSFQNQYFSLIDRIEYDVTVQIFALQLTRWRLRACACVCACMLVPKKSNRECCVLRVSLMYAFRRAYGLTYKMATYVAAKGLFNTIHRRNYLTSLCEWN